MPPGTALEAARELAGRVALAAPLALAAAKRVIVESADWPAAEAFARQADIITPVFSSRDAAEGALAFAESAARYGAASDRLAWSARPARVSRMQARPGASGGLLSGARP